jgi:hypothetical protein
MRVVVRDPAKAEGVNIVAEQRSARTKIETLAKRLAFMIFLPISEVDCAVAWPNLRNLDRVNA